MSDICFFTCCTWDLNSFDLFYATLGRFFTYFDIFLKIKIVKYFKHSRYWAEIKILTRPRHFHKFYSLKTRWLFDKYQSFYLIMRIIFSIKGIKFGSRWKNRDKTHLSLSLFLGRNFSLRKFRRFKKNLQVEFSNFQPLVVYNNPEEYYRSRADWSPEIKLYSPRLL